MTDMVIEDRDEAVAEAITGGKSLRLVRKQFALSEGELDAILERLWPLSHEGRIRMIKHDLTCLQRLIEKLYEKGLAGDVNAATACIRAWERKAALLGLDAAQRIDLQVVPQEAAQGYDRIYEVLQEMAHEGRQPNDGNGSDSE